MKILIWIYEHDLERLNKGERVEYFPREPGIYEQTIQIIIDLDTYQKLQEDE